MSFQITVLSVNKNIYIVVIVIPSVFKRDPTMVKHP